MMRAVLFRFSVLVFGFVLPAFLSALEPSMPQTCGEDGSCGIGVRTLVFFDVARERPIITEVYYPAETKAASSEENRNAPILSSQKKWPLIVMSHGYPGDRYSFAWLQKILAANGYIVAAPDHFGSTHYMHRAEDSLKRWDRPKDISLLIDNMLKASYFKEHIDAEKIGFAGYSYGGLTGVWLAGGMARKYPTPSTATSTDVELDRGATQAIIDSIDFSKAKRSYEDKRIKALFLMAPAYGFAFDKEGLSTIEIPTLIVAAQNDGIFPLKENAQFFADHIRSSDIKMINHGAGHDAFLSEDECSGVRGFCERPKNPTPKDVRKQVHEEVAALAIKFFNKYVNRP